MMNILNEIEKVFNENNVRYKKETDKKNKILKVIYRGIGNEKNRITIYIDTNNPLNLINFFFLAKINESVSIDIVREKLLDLNTKLVLGTLSMGSDSNIIEYRLDYSLNDHIFSYDVYNRNIVLCIKVYERLQKEGII